MTTIIFVLGAVPATVPVPCHEMPRQRILQSKNNYLAELMSGSGADLSEGDTHLCIKFCFRFKCITCRAGHSTT